MIEIKLSPRSSAGPGGVLPGIKNTPEIAEISWRKSWDDKFYRPLHNSAFQE